MLPLGNTLHNLMTDKGAAYKQANHRNVNNGGNHNAIGAIVVVLTPDFVRSLGS